MNAYANVNDLRKNIKNNNVLKGEENGGTSKSVYGNSINEGASTSDTISRIQRYTSKKSRFDYPTRNYDVLHEKDEEDLNQDDVNDTLPGNEFEASNLSINDDEPDDDNSSDMSSEKNSRNSQDVQFRSQSCLGYPRSTNLKRLDTLPRNSFSFSTHLQTEKSLFSDKNLSKVLNSSTTSLNSLHRRKSFNASVYGSTSALSDSRLLNINSPFYNGRTIYGGASAYSRGDSATKKRMLRVPTQMQPSSSLSNLSMTSSTNSLEQAGLSSTAKRIMELMNQFTTPLTEVKKLAIKMPTLPNQRKRFDDSVLSMNRSSRNSTPYTRPRQNDIPEPLINELQVPSMAQLLQLKKFQNNTERIRNVADKSKSVLNSVQEYKLPSDELDAGSNLGKHVNKMRSKITSELSGRKNDNLIEETIPPPNLPNIPFPTLKSVPNFDLGIKLPVSKPSISVPQMTVEKKITNTPVAPIAFKSQSPPAKNPVVNNIQNKKELNTMFKFSEPSKLNAPVCGNQTTSGIMFKFSEPMQVTESKTQESRSLNGINDSKDKDSDKSPRLILGGNSADKPIVSTNNTKSQLNVMDICKTTENKENKTVSSFGDAFKMTKDKWECPSCMLQHTNNISKCTACNTSKPGSGTPVQTKVIESTSVLPKTTPTANSLSALFKPASGSWECDMCMVRNKTEDSTCASCTTPKPKPKISQSIVGNDQLSSTKPISVEPAKDDLFKKLVSNQTAKWECTACMTRNDPSKTKCLCCEQPKPGAEGENVPQFSFGTTSKFTFGVPKNTTSSSNEKSSTIEPVKPSGGFTFGIPSTSSSVNGFSLNKPETVKDDGKSLANSDTKLTNMFSFGTTKPQQKSSFMFGSNTSVAPSIKTFDLKSDSNKTSANTGLPAPAKVGFSFGNMASSESVSAASPVSSLTKPSVETKPLIPTVPQNILTATFSTPAKDEKADTPKIKTGGISSVFGTTTTNQGFSFGNKTDAPTNKLSFTFGATPNPIATTAASVAATETTTKAIAFGSLNSLESAKPATAAPFGFGGSSLSKPPVAIAAPEIKTDTTSTSLFAATSNTIAPSFSMPEKKTDSLPAFGSFSSAPKSAFEMPKTDAVTFGSNLSSSTNVFGGFNSSNSSTGLTNPVKPIVNPTASFSNISGFQSVVANNNAAIGSSQSTPNIQAPFSFTTPTEPANVNNCY